MSDWVRKLAQKAKQEQADRDRHAQVVSAQGPLLWDQLLAVVRGCLEAFNHAFQGDAEREVRWIQSSNHLLYIVRKYRPDPMPASLYFDVARGRIETRVEMDTALTRHFILPEPQVLESVQIVSGPDQDLHLEHHGRSVTLDEASELLLRPLLFQTAAAGRGATAPTHP